MKLTAGKYLFQTELNIGQRMETEPSPNRLNLCAVSDGHKINLSEASEEDYDKVDTPLIDLISNSTRQLKEFDNVSMASISGMPRRTNSSNMQHLFAYTPSSNQN